MVTQNYWQAAFFSGAIIAVLLAIQLSAVLKVRATGKGLPGSLHIPAPAHAGGDLPGPAAARRVGAGRQAGGGEGGSGGVRPGEHAQRGALAAGGAA